MAFILFILGLSMFASWFVFFVNQHGTAYRDRTAFHKVNTWFAIATFVLYVIGSTN